MKYGKTICIGVAIRLIAASLFVIVTHAVAAPAPDEQPVVNKTFEYTGTYDQVSPLKALIAFRPDKQLKPLIVCMHGFSEDAARYVISNRYLAESGWFVACVEMRGRDGSAGKFDSGGLEIHDIYDAVEALIAKYPDEIDPSRVGIQGWSGGGGNVIGAMVRLPETFNVGASFFGIPDYGRWQEILDEIQPGSRGPACILGTTPKENPDIYIVRDYKRAAINCRAAKVWIFNDHKEATCLPDMDQAFYDAAKRGGLKNVTLTLTGPEDAARYRHESTWDELYHANPLFLDPLKAGKLSPPRLSSEGELVALGFVITQRFRIYCGDGQNAAAKVRYHMSDESFEFEYQAITSNPNMPFEVRIPKAHGVNIKTASLDGKPIEVIHKDGFAIVRSPRLNGKLILTGRYQTK